MGCQHRTSSLDFKFPGSIQETPLPPVPMPQPKEPIYEELCQDTLLSRRRFKSNIDLHENQDLPMAPGKNTYFLNFLKISGY